MCALLYLFSLIHVVWSRHICIKAIPAENCNYVAKWLHSRTIHCASCTWYIMQGLSMETLVKMCLDIAEGMAYLAEKKFVHRDLAARNCMWVCYNPPCNVHIFIQWCRLDSHLSVLVGNFGLARDIYCTDYYRAGSEAQLPVKWMPPEALKDGITTEKTDVVHTFILCQ